LRHPKCVSTINDMAKGSFKEVIDDASAIVGNIDTVVFCTGKIYYDLLAKKELLEKVNHIALVRLEQLYPLPIKQIEKIIAKYKNAKKHIWAQEEPENMGAWSYILRHCKSTKLEIISLGESGSPATGSAKTHAIRHNEILSKVFNIKKPKLVFTKQK